MDEIEDRSQVEEVISRMDEEDEIVSAALDAIASHATTFVDPDEDREIIVSQTTRRLIASSTRCSSAPGCLIRCLDITRTTVEKGITSVRWYWVEMGA